MKAGHEAGISPSRLDEFRPAALLKPFSFWGKWSFASMAGARGANSFAGEGHQRLKKILDMIFRLEVCHKK
jgi:hypothetical protein